MQASKCLGRFELHQGVYSGMIYFGRVNILKKKIKTKQYVSLATSRRNRYLREHILTALQNDIFILYSSNMNSLHFINMDIDASHTATNTGRGAERGLYFYKAFFWRLGGEVPIA